MRGETDISLTQSTISRPARGYGCEVYRADQCFLEGPTIIPRPVRVIRSETETVDLLLRITKPQTPMTL